MPYDRIGAKKGALAGLRNYARGKIGEDLKSAKDERDAPLEGDSDESSMSEDRSEEDLKAMGDEGPDKTLEVVGVELPAEESVAGEEDVSLDDIPPELIEKLLAALGE